MCLLPVMGIFQVQGSHFDWQQVMISIKKTLALLFLSLYDDKIFDIKNKKSSSISNQINRLS